MTRARFGAELTREAEEVLSNAPGPDEIFESMDALNEEIEETVQAAQQVPFEQKKPEVKVRNLTPQKEKVEVTKPAQENKPLIVQRKTEPMKPMKENSLEKDLASLEQSMQKEPTPEQLEEISKQRIREALDRLNGPSEKQINAWKSEVGKNGIHITIFSEDEMYIYTHLTRAMWQQVQKMLDKMRESKDTVKEEELRELVVKHCVKWPALSTEWKYNSRAGVVDSLFESIWYHSYFFTPQQVQSLTTQL